MYIELNRGLPGFIPWCYAGDTLSPIVSAVNCKFLKMKVIWIEKL